MRTGFHVRCAGCGRRLEIGRVSLFKRRSRVGGEELFSYGYACPCGCTVEIDGVTGDGIPEEMKADAIQRRSAHLIQTKTNYERRDLPASSVKRTLKESRPQLPCQQEDSGWLVYDIADYGEVLYYEDPPRYHVVFADGAVLAFSSITELADHLQARE